MKIEESFRDLKNLQSMDKMLLLSALSELSSELQPPAIDKWDLNYYNRTINELLTWNRAVR
jgi:hypothetical protein